MTVTMIRKPFKEPPFAPVLAEADPELAESLTHYDLDNGYTVSVLHSVFGWEAWAWPTTDEKGGHKDALTPEPIVYSTEEEALAYRDEIGVLA